jgi:hypothetical protein
MCSSLLRSYRRSVSSYINLKQQLSVCLDVRIVAVHVMLTVGWPLMTRCAYRFSQFKRRSANELQFSHEMQNVEEDFKVAINCT